jgi:hypothetical protein
MILQAVQFSLHAYYLVGERPHDRSYAIVNNIDTLGVLLCILVGTLLAWRQAGLVSQNNCRQRGDMRRPRQISPCLSI